MTDEGIAMLKGHEGLRLRAYRCPAGKLTIGFGHTAGVKEGDIITTETANMLLAEDIAVAERDAHSLLKNFDQLTPRRQDALINLSFNVGRVTLGKLTSMLNYIRLNRFAAAANSMTRYKWAKQVGAHRSGDIIAAIREG